MFRIKYLFAVALFATVALTGCAGRQQLVALTTANVGGPSDSGLSGFENGGSESSAVRDYVEVLADPGPF